MYFTLLPELGIVGIFIMGIMLRELIQKSRKTRKLCGVEGACEQVIRIEGLIIAFMTSLFGFMVTGVFLSVLYYAHFWNIAALIVALYVVAVRTAPKDTNLSPMSQM